MVRSIRLWRSDCASPLTHDVHHGLTGMCLNSCFVFSDGRLTWCGEWLRSCLNGNSVSVNVWTNHTIASFAAFQLVRVIENLQLVSMTCVNLLLVRMTFATIVNLQLVRPAFVNLQLVYTIFVNLALVRMILPDFRESPARTNDFVSTHQLCESPARTHQFCGSLSRTHDPLTKYTPCVSALQEMVLLRGVFRFRVRTNN